jgi:hypothetical protein
MSGWLGRVNGVLPEDAHTRPHLGPKAVTTTSGAANSPGRPDVASPRFRIMYTALAPAEEKNTWERRVETGKDALGGMRQGRLEAVVAPWCKCHSSSQTIPH